MKLFLCNRIAACQPFRNKQLHAFKSALMTSQMPGLQLRCFPGFRSHITFGLMTPGQMRKNSHLHVVATTLYNPYTRIPTAYGVLDRRLVSRQSDERLV